MTGRARPVKPNILYECRRRPSRLSTKHSPPHNITMASKPTIVLIPGACTEPSCFDGLRSCLRDAGYESVAVSHPSANPTDPFAHTAETMGLNVQENYIQPLLDAGKEILVFGYSSGGSETGTSGPSWVLSDREARGHKGGVIGIVYLSSALPPAGVPQLAVMGGVWPPMVKPDTVWSSLVPSSGKIGSLTYVNPLAQTRPLRLRPHHPLPFQRRRPL